jgi:hypothetical protein
MGRDSTPSLEASPQHPHEFTPSDIRRDCRAYRRLVERESHLADRQDPEAERQHAQLKLNRNLIRYGERRAELEAKYKMRHVPMKSEAKKKFQSSILSGPEGPEPALGRLSI